MPWITREMLMDAVGRCAMPEPTSFRPVQHYAPSGARMIAMIEQLESKLAAIELILDAHRAALVAAGWLNVDGTLPTPSRRPRVWRWESEADRVRPVLPALPGGGTWRTRDRHGDVHDWKAGRSEAALWEATWEQYLMRRGPMTEVFDDSE